MQRFFLPQENFKENFINITDKKELHHIHDVLRLNVGESVELLNGKGVVCLGEIEDIQKNKTKMKIVERKKHSQQTPYIHLMCAVPKKDRWVGILEKASELGVNEITPLQTANTEVIWSEKDFAKKRLRFENILISSAKQTCAPYLPQLNNPILFKNAIANIPRENCLQLLGGLEGETLSLQDSLKKNKTCNKIVVYIGPEGDFTPEEYEMAIQSGVTLVTLGDQILRVDTAALALVSFIRLFQN